MEEYLSRKYNNIYFILMIIVSLPFISIAIIVALININEIVLERKISSILFILFYISVFIFFTWFSYMMNTIIYHKSKNQIVIKRPFLSKTFDVQDFQEIDRYILPFLNYIKINGKTYLFISRTIDPLGGCFNLNFEQDLREIRNLLKENKCKS